MSRALRIVGGVIATGACVAALPTPAWAVPGDFASAGEFATGNTPFEIGTGDFDDDGDIDAAVPNANGANVTVLLNDGDGTFTTAPGSPVETAGTPRGLAVGDFDGDGLDDFAVTEDQTDTVRIVLSDGDGTFTSNTPIAAGVSPSKLAVGLFDANAVPDLAIANTGVDPSPGAVTVMLGNGSGGFAPASESPITTEMYTYNITVGDIDADGPDDIAASNLSSDNVNILIGDGDGTFTEPATSPEAVGDGPEGLAIGDLQGGPGADLVVANTFSANTSVLIGDGAGNFTAAASSPEPEGGNDTALGTLDGDGDLDIATFDGPDKAAFLMNDGAANYTLGSTTPVRAFATKVAIADLDDDGDEDVLTSGGNGGEYVVTPLLNDELDTDDDGVLDLADLCPDLPGTTEGCPVFHPTLTIKYKKRAEAFKGTVTSTETTCAAGITVKVFRNKNGGPELQGKGKTNDAGRYRVDKKVKRGSFFPTTPRSVDPEIGICAAAQANSIFVQP